MDPKTSFNLPLLLKKNTHRASLSPKIHERLNSTIAFKDPTQMNQSFRDTREAQELSPRQCMRLNPGYRPDYSIVKSEMRTRYRDFSKGRQRDITVDKIFHKKKDEMVNYAEQFFKNKILHVKK